MDYKTLCKKIKQYKKIFNVKIIGKSIFKRKIFAVEKQVNPAFFTAVFLCSVHGRESIATDMVCKMIDDGIFNKIKDFNLSFILMANPDGVELSNYGIKSAPVWARKELLEFNKNSTEFSLWKANGRGVDINNNFDANWGTNVHSNEPASSGFDGNFAESEPETQALVRYTKKINPFITISYHSKGEEIYYNFFQKERFLERDKKIAERFASSTGYVIKNPEKTSSGGYKDHCVMNLKIPALTIELGSDNLTHPIKLENLNEIYFRNKDVAKDLEFAYNVFVESKYGLSREIYEKSDCTCKKSGTA
ncbi:MAG: hypothetical protein IJ538_04210 [Clostridia bacterium]|nr:hypothetical protein [Clostridia bacterium]